MYNKARKRSKKIVVGHVYCFSKSGSIVEVKAPAAVELGGKTIKGFDVRRIDSGKEFFVPRGALLPLSVLQNTCG